MGGFWEDAEGAQLVSAVCLTGSHGTAPASPKFSDSGPFTEPGEIQMASLETSEFHYLINILVQALQRNVMTLHILETAKDRRKVQDYWCFMSILFIMQKSLVGCSRGIWEFLHWGRLAGIFR